jgi:threonine synthase
MRRWIFSVSITDEETKKTIRRVYDKYGIPLEPHGAVGWRGLEVYLERYGDFPLCISIETAHPAKFPDEIIDLLGISPELPESMKDIDHKEGKPIELSASYEEFKNYLKSRLKVRS